MLRFQDHHGEGLFLGVGDGQGHVLDAELGGDLGGSPVEVQRGAAGGEVHHFEIAPGDAVPAGAERLHAGLLGCEAGGVALEAVGFAVGVGGSQRCRVRDAQQDQQPGADLAHHRTIHCHLCLADSLQEGAHKF